MTSHSTPAATVSHRRRPGRSGSPGSASRRDRKPSHSPARIGCNRKKVYSSIGTQPMVTPVTSAASYHQTLVATR